MVSFLVTKRECCCLWLVQIDGNLGNLTLLYLIAHKDFPSWFVASNKHESVFANGELIFRQRTVGQ